jgi:hypothetical protein
MKNLKNTISAVGLMAVLALGAVSANAGMIISDRATGQCTVKDGGILQQIAGIIIVGAPALSGMIISDAPTPGCEDKNGMIISDRNGMIISD